MSAFVNAVDELKRRFGCHVMVIHHSGAPTRDRARGSSVLRAAVDTEIRIDRSGYSEKLTMVMTKQKDAEMMAPIDLTFRTVAAHLPNGKEITSKVVLDWQEDTIIDPDFEGRMGGLSPAEVKIIEFLRIGSGATTKEIAEHVGRGANNVGKTLRDLEKKGLLQAVPLGEKNAIFWRIMVEEDNPKDEE